MKRTDLPDPDDHIDWSLATWEGSRREQLRRWAALPLERAIMAVEEMQAVADNLYLQAWRAEKARTPESSSPVDPHRQATNQSPSGEE